MVPEQYQLAIALPDPQFPSAPRPLPAEERPGQSAAARQSAIDMQNPQPAPYADPHLERNSPTAVENPQLPAIPQSETSSPTAASDPKSELPSRRGRPRALGRDTRAGICGLIASGASLRQAARYVDCDPRSVRREAQRNPYFRDQLARARAEAGMHPLEALRQAAKTNWRAALCWMERVDPERYARPDASIVTKREANQFVADLVESIERTVSDTQDRANLYKLLSAAMPGAMRGRWNSQASRRCLKQAMRDIDNKRDEEVQRRGEFTQTVVGYLSGQLAGQLGDDHDVADPDVIRSERAHSGRANRAPEEALDKDPANGSPLQDGRVDDGPAEDGPLEGGPLDNGAASSDFDGSPNVGCANNASPDRILSHDRGEIQTITPHGHEPNPVWANDLREPPAAKLAE